MQESAHTREPLISVVIPAYNEREYIVGCLESIRAQGYERHETIVVANNCQDDTAGVARELADLVVETPQQGISLAKNLGADLSQGQILAFLDADSHMLPGLLEHTVMAVQEGYSGGKAKHVPLDDDSIIARLWTRYSELNSKFWLPFSSIDGGAGAYTFLQRVMWDRIVAEEGEGYNTKKKVMEDVDMAIRIKKRGAFRFITETGIATSMRRFQEEGYVRLLIKDSIDYFFSEQADRSRWNK